MRYSIAAWIALLLALCIAPLEVKTSLHTHGRFHDAGHIIVFAVTGALFSLPRKAASLRTFGLVAAAALAFFTEWLEHWVYGNRIEWGDVQLDLIGVLVASLVVLTLTTALTLCRRPSD